ncbi:S-layer family protein [Halanaerobium saccharolyticum]|uniref:S-layer family protein n=2 Tax=Halanaerobium saccharolyticum TaxID=43595 RepID=A0A2T5RT72_9FIRM|nr:S-layer family protein [Halanaerobium saccharolyticum]
MKKLTITIALLLVVALAMPAFGQSFSDVPSDHWAYDAINKLVAAGIVEGYPDGEYKGDQNMTRYEMAVMVSRALDNIVAEQEALADEVDAMGEGLTTGQAEDVTAIVKSLMEKNTSDSLSDAQAEEVADIVDALTFELRAELKVLGADVDALGKDVADLEAKVDGLDIPEDNIEWAATVDTVAEAGNYTGSGVDLIPGDEISEQDFYQEAGISLSGSVANADYNLDLVTLFNGFEDFSTTDDNSFALDSALLEVAYNGVNVKLGDLNEYAVETYFVNEEDVEGMEMTANYQGYHVKTIVTSLDADTMYGITAGREFDIADVTGKVYHARNNGALHTMIAGEVTDFALTEEVVMGAEVVYDNETEGIYVTADGEVTAVEALTLKPFVNYANEDFVPYMGDLDDEFGDGTQVVQAGVNADYVLNEDNTLHGGFTFTDNDAAENKMVASGGITNTYGDFTNNANVEYTMNDEYTADQEKILVEADTAFALDAKTDLTANVSYETADHIADTTVFGVGADYAWDDSLVLGAAYTYKNVDEGMNYSFVKATADKTLTENISWNTEVNYITGEDADAVEGEGNGVKTALSVSF